MAKKASDPQNRLENVLAFMTVGVIATSIICIAIVLVSYYLGVAQLPVFLRLVPLIGLPLGMILIVTLVIVSARRRAREAK
jgi:FtsH-binding integral membrane protein